MAVRFCYYAVVNIIIDTYILETPPSETIPPTAATSSTEYVPFLGKSEPSFFISEELKNDILNRNMLTLLQPDPSQYPDLPQEVDSYHELFPLEPISNQVCYL